MSVTIKDIARKARVSPATVSLVLNNKPGVGAEMRSLIQKLAKDLDYKKQEPSATGSNKTSAICLLHISRHGHTLNRDHDVFIADYIEGLGRGAKAFGFSLEILTFKTTPIDQIISAARDSNAPGLIVLGTELSSMDIALFSSVGKPVVFIDTFDYYQPFDFVDMNNEESVHTMITHLYDKGHREIGFVKSSVETRNFKLREVGFRGSLNLLGLKYHEEYCFSVDSTFHGAYADMKHILATEPRLPSALFCANDIIACGCMKAFQDFGIQIGKDISLVGFDDLPLAAVMDPPLTTIKVLKAQIGTMAMQIVTSRLGQNADSPSVKVLIAGALVERQSVKNISTT